MSPDFNQAVRWSLSNPTERSDRFRHPARDTRVFNAPGTYTFKVKGSNFCPDGTEKTQEISVVITVTNSCAIPTINNFTASPDTVYTGGNQNIIFNWNVSGQIDAQSIDQGIGAVNGSSHTIIQPQTTTTYTYTVVGCGQTRQAQIIVNVSTSPGCTITSPNQPDATAGGGAAGSSSLPNDTSTSAFFRIKYWIKHFPDGTYKFNTQLYYTYEKPYSSVIIVPTFATLYVVEFGCRKLNIPLIEWNFGMV